MCQELFDNVTLETLEDHFKCILLLDLKAMINTSAGFVDTAEKLQYNSKSTLQFTVAQASFI